MSDPLVFPENINSVREKWKRAAKKTIQGKRQRISISIPERNLSRIRAIALRRGIPYQTLINEKLQQLVQEDLEKYPTR